MNWKLGNRREAGMLLSHISGSGVEATEVVAALSRLLKQVVSIVCNFFAMSPFPLN